MVTSKGSPLRNSIWARSMLKASPGFMPSRSRIFSACFRRFAGTRVRNRTVVAVAIAQICSKRLRKATCNESCVLAVAAQCKAVMQAFPLETVQPPLGDIVSCVWPRSVESGLFAPVGRVFWGKSRGIGILPLPCRPTCHRLALGLLGAVGGIQSKRKP